ncbi:MAG: hypothetical protein V4509_01875 [Patescibacteria group bacterium]
MSWNPALPAYTSKLALSPGYIQSNNGSIQSVLTANNLNGGIPYIPNTAPMWFYTNVAPAGWTATGVGGDSLLAIKGGSSQYSVSGGSQVGTWIGPGYALLSQDVQSNGPNQPSFNYIQTLASGTTYDNTPPTAHHHDWTTTRPTASLGILCVKNT